MEGVLTRRIVVMYDCSMKSGMIPSRGVRGGGEADVLLPRDAAGSESSGCSGTAASSSLRRPSRGNGRLP